MPRSIHLSGRLPWQLLVAASLFLFCAASVFAIDADTHAIENGEATVIHILNSMFAIYEKPDAKEGKKGGTMTLSGDAIVSVERGGSKSVIEADVIRLDRQNSMMYANGHIKITQFDGGSSGDFSMPDGNEESGSKTETTAESILINTRTMEGVFDDGKVIKLSSSNDDNTSLIVRSDIFGKGKNNTIAFKNGSLTFCDDDDPHWRIDASRIWMLPGGEFAFFNALVYVGQVPVLYLPAFYYPKDELIFNPVMGYDKKLGYFVQTTTYLYGRKSLESYNTASYADGEDESSFNFTKPAALKEQRLEGIVLHNLEKNYTGKTDNFVKFMADWYGNMGYGFGLDSNFSGLEGAVSSIQAGFKMGFTETVFSNASGNWKPYSPSGKSYDDKAVFIGFHTPFRYEANFALTLVSPFTMNIKLPIYSDPFFHDDFANRSETMDWINYLLTASKGNNTEDEEEDNQDKERTGVSNFEWLLTTGYSLPDIDAIQPYLSSASINTKSGITFAAAVNNALREDTPEIDRDAVMLRSPNQKFFYPSIVTPINASADFAGTILEYEEGSPRFARKRKRAKESEENALMQNMAPPEVLAAEKMGEDEGEGKTGDAKEDSGGEEESGDEGDITDALPLLNIADSAITNVPGLKYSLSYGFNPDYTSQIAYSSAGLDGPDDFDWSNRKSYMYTLRLPVSLTNALSAGGEAASVKNTITYDPFWQDHPYLSHDTEKGGYTEEAAKSVMTADYTATKQTLTSGSTLSLKPFYYIPHFKDTGIKYSQDVKIFTTNFIGDADNPKWELLTTDWSEEDFVPVHQLQAIFAATEGYDDKIGQTLTLTAALPPRPDEYISELELFVPHVSYTISAGIKQKSSEDDTWVKQDLKQALAVTLFDKNPLRFTASYNYNMEENYNDNLKLALDWAGFQAAYQMSYTRGYDFVDGDGWVQKDDEEFQPYSFSLAYAPVPWTVHRWKNRIALRLGINTSIVSDLLKPTDSYFIFEPVIAFNIHKAFTIAFSATTKNSVIYRYVQKMLGCDGRVPGEDNMWKDLLNSFRFDDEDLRKASGFKLKSINIDISHSLHDWDLNATYKMTPRLVTEGKNKRYDFSPYAAISVVWRPMSSMRTELRDDYGRWQLNP